MSKSSKAKKRVIKMIRAEGSILGESNLAYDEYTNDFKKYCQEKIDYYKGIYSNKELLKYYKDVVIPQTKGMDAFSNDMVDMGNIFNNLGVTHEQLDEMFKKVSN